MSKLSGLVIKYYPHESITNDVNAEFSTSLNTIFGKNMDFFNSSSLKIPFVETKRMLFFDIRPIYFNFKPWVSKINPINLVISLIVIISMPIILFNFIRDMSHTSPAFIVFISVIGIPWLMIILRWNKTITNIIAIKKAWITKDVQENGGRTITWSMPENEVGFSFVHLIDEDAKQKLSFLLKLQSGMYFKKPNNSWLGKMSPVDFQNVVFKVKE